MTATNSRKSASPEFAVSLDESDGAALLFLRGELDLHTAPTLDNALAPFMNGGGARDVVLDLSELEFVDSTGLRTIMSAASTIERRGAEVVIRRPRAATMRVLEICGITKMMRIDGSGEPPADATRGVGG